MSTHIIGFYEDLTTNCMYLSIIIKFHQLRTLFLLLNTIKHNYCVSPVLNLLSLDENMGELFSIFASIFYV